MRKSLRTLVATATLALLMSLGTGFASAADTAPTPAPFPYARPGANVDQPGIGLSEGLSGIDRNIDSSQTGIIKEKSLTALVNGWTSFFLQYYMIVAVGILIYLGVRLVVSAGKEEERKKLIQALINLVIGTLIIFLSYVIVNQVVSIVDPTGGADATPPADSGVQSNIQDLTRFNGTTK